MWSTDTVHRSGPGERRGARILPRECGSAMSLRTAIPEIEFSPGEGNSVVREAVTAVTEKRLVSAGRVRCGKSPPADRSRSSGRKPRPTTGFHPQDRLSPARRRPSHRSPAEEDTRTAGGWRPRLALRSRPYTCEAGVGQPPGEGHNMNNTARARARHWVGHRSRCRADGIDRNCGGSALGKASESPSLTCSNPGRRFAVEMDGVQTSPARASSPGDYKLALNN